MKRRFLAAAVLAVLAAAAAIYLNSGYQASGQAYADMETGVHHGHAQAFVPEQPRAGIIFYPGGKVDHAAYAPLMRMLADRGVLALLAEMPLDLAVLDMKAADGLQALYPQVDRWLIGGHSLGGAMAASYVSEHTREYEGLVLLGAYSTADLSEKELAVLSVYGSEDGVLNRGKYESCRAHYPADFTEVVIEGGCHAYFGDYGAQKGDGEPTITREEQMERTADAIVAMLE